MYIISKFKYLLIHFVLQITFIYLFTWISLKLIFQDIIGIFWIPNSIGVLFMLDINNTLKNKYLTSISPVVFSLSYYSYRILITPEIDRVLSLLLTIVNTFEIITIFILFVLFNVNIYQNFVKLKDVIKFIVIIFVSCSISSTLSAFSLMYINHYSFDNHLIEWFLTDFAGLFNILYLFANFYSFYNGVKNHKYINCKMIIKNLIIFSIPITCIGIIYLINYNSRIICFPLVFLSINIIKLCTLYTEQLMSSAITFITVIIVIISPLIQKGPIYYILKDDKSYNIIAATLTCTIMLSITNCITSTVIKASKNKTEELNKLFNEKVAFFAHIGHEFRTPLSTICATSEEMLFDNGKHFKSDIKSIHYAATSMSKNVNDIMDLFKFNNEPIKIVSELSNISVQINNVCRTFISHLEHKNIELITNLSDKCKFPIYTDIHRVNQILNNLISNAIKYTFREGIITINADIVGDYIPDTFAYLYISITDSGIGLSEIDCVNVLKDFYSCGKIRNIIGTGLGLSIVQHILKNMNGDLIVKSDGPDKGTTFAFKIKIKFAQIMKDSIYNTRWSINVINHEAYNNVNILIVEDSKQNSKILKRIIQDIDITINIDTVFCCKDGLDIIMQNKYDMIFLDLGLPDGSGLDIRNLILTNTTKCPKNITIILITATIIDFIDASLKNDVNIKYCLKPFSRDVIIETVNVTLIENQKKYNAIL